MVGGVSPKASYFPAAALALTTWLLVTLAMAACRKLLC